MEYLKAVKNVMTDIITEVLKVSALIIVQKAILAKTEK
jgi:hypothetical protein